MSKEKIIIDGCDVSGCYELYNGCCCDNGSFYCSDQPNCKFKLEKRGYKIEQITEFTPREELIETITHLRVLNAELESYNEQLKESQNIEIKENKILREELKRKELECEKKSWVIGNLGYKIKNQRKEINIRLEQLDQLKAKLELFKKSNITTIDQLKAEIETLKQYKASKQASYESMQREWDEAVNENRDLKGKVNELEEELQFAKDGEQEWLKQYKLAQEQRVKTDVENNKYKQALEEIKEVATLSQAHNNKDYLQKVIIEILQKISECGVDSGN